MTFGPGGKVTEPTAYPLAWPSAWPRTPAAERREARFTSLNKSLLGSTSKPITLSDARERLSSELKRLGADSALLSTNLQLGVTGQPKANQAEPADCGAAIYFALRNKPTVLACDRWNRVAANVAAIAAHIGAMRAMDRWGVGSVEQMFTGYQALPAPDDWRALLGHPKTIDEARAAWIAGIKGCGNQGPTAVALNTAMDRARQELAG